MGRKDYLWQHMNSQRIRFPSEYSITPMSFILSEEYDTFEADRRHPENEKSLYILKPVAASCGRGIRIIDNPNA